jgi:hypothetical protein
MVEFVGVWNGELEHLQVVGLHLNQKQLHYCVARA